MNVLNIFTFRLSLHFLFSVHFLLVSTDSFMPVCFLQWVATFHDVISFFNAESFVYLRKRNLNKGFKNTENTKPSDAYFLLLLLSKLSFLLLFCM